MLATPSSAKSRRRLTPATVFEGLAREIHLLAPVYKTLHTTHPALAAYPTLPTLLERLTKDPHDTAKKELLATLVAIRQASPHRVWVAILLRAFRPMLAKVWKKLFGSDSEERLALLILAFQEALRDVDPIRDPVRIAMYVRQATRRRAIASLVKEVEWGNEGFGEDADTVPDEREPDTPQERQVVHRCLERGELVAHVRRTYPEMSREEKARLCRKLRRGLRRLSGAPQQSEVLL